MKKKYNLALVLTAFCSLYSFELVFSRNKLCKRGDPGN